MHDKNLGLRGWQLQNATPPQASKAPKRRASTEYRRAQASRFDQTADFWNGSRAEVFRIESLTDGPVHPSMEHIKCVAVVQFVR